MSNSNQREDVLYNQAATCRKSFRALLVDGPGESRTVVEEQQARFNIWAANIGVFANPEASLDYRLSESPEILRMIGQLLDLIYRNLERAITAPSSTGVPNREEPTDKHSASLVRLLRRSRNPPGAPVPTEPETRELSLEALRAVKEGIDRLQRLSSAIRLSSAQSRFAKAATYVEKDEEGNDISSGFRQFAMQMVEHRYKNADFDLCTHLANSMFLRRNGFLYRERHQRKLAKEREQQSLTAGRTEVKPEGITLGPDRGHRTLRGQPRIGVTNFPSLAKGRAAKSVALSGTEFSAPLKPGLDYKSMLGARLRPSVAGSTSSVPMQEESVTYPPPPEFEPGLTEGQCPYCFEPFGMSNFVNPRRWHHHVDRDLNPYVCLFKECRGSLEFFDRFSDWLDHTQKLHACEWWKLLPFKWCCNAITHEPLAFATKDEFEIHMKDSHAGAFTESQLPIISERSAQPSSRLSNICPLCNCVPEGIADLEKKLGKAADDLLPKHIAGHLKSLSFLCLPWTGVVEEASHERQGALAAVSIDPSVGEKEEGRNDRINDPAFEQMSLPCSSDPSDNLRDVKMNFYLDDPREGRMEDPRERLERDEDLRWKNYKDLEWAFISRQEYSQENDPIIQHMLSRRLPDIPFSLANTDSGYRDNIGLKLAHVSDQEINPADDSSRPRPARPDAPLHYSYAVLPRPQRQPDHAQAIQDFLRFVNEESVSGTHGPSSTVNRPFMPLRRLQNYFEGQSHQRTNDILQALFLTDEPPIESVEILQNCPRVFAILLCIGKGRFIESFARHHNLRDNKLPFEACPKNFPNTTDDEHFWESFYKQQWQFCPYTFQNDTDTELEKECILPIIRKERLAEGDSAVAYKIKLHSAYDQLNTSSVRRLNPSERFANTYVLKTYYTKDAYVYYKTEVDAFKKLVWDGSPDSSIIGFYGSYIQDGTYNVLLEYADKGNLEEYFQRTQPPSTGDDIIKFWTGLFNVLKALSRIHQVRQTASPNVATGLQIFQGWHQDVKPANILVVTGKGDSPYDCDFKLADLGLSHFQRTMKPQLDNLGMDNNGTREYDAPECYRWDEFLERSKLQVPRSVDIWSLGCIYSEAAVWVVLGSDGLSDYRRKRKIETDRIYSFKDDGCFHDGVKILNTVRNFHDKVRGNIRKNDHVTELVLDIISDMLVAANSRPPPLFLLTKSSLILQTAQERLKSPKLEPKSFTVDPGEDRPKTPPELPPSATQDVLIRERSASPHELKRESAKVRPPRLTIEDASIWIRQKEAGARVPPLANKGYLNELNRRDHVFLVDDAASMQKHWNRVILVFYVLAYLLKDSDPDGMDLLYTVSVDKQKSKKPDRLREHLRTVSCGGRSDIGLRLGAILHEYAKNLQVGAKPQRIFGISRKKKQTRPMNLYILTDAVWQPHSDVVKPIRTLIRKLDELGLPEYQVGIQFILFGQNQEGINRLEHLDSGLESSRDIVDSEASDGNVWKMLLGAVNKWFR